MPVVGSADAESEIADKVGGIAKALGLSGTTLAGDRAGAMLIELIRGMAANGHAPDDPMREIFARLGDKWSMLLLLLLRAGPFRHATLRKLVTIIESDARISQRMFTLRLRSLERDGLVMRTITPVVPPRVTYALTELGEELMVRVDALMLWIGAHGTRIRAAREAFDVAAAEDDWR